MKTKFLWKTGFIAFILCLIIEKTLLADISFLLSPPSSDIKIPSGGKKKVTITLLNQSKTSANFRIFAASIKETEKGKYKVLDTKKGKWSCAEWIKLSHRHIKLGPNESEDIIAKIHIPRGNYGGRYAAIVAELVPWEKTEKAQARVKLFWRMASIVSVTIPRFGLTPKPSLKNFQVESPSKDSKYVKKFGKNVLLVKCSIKNEGKIHLAAKGNLRIKNQKGTTLVKTQLGSGRGRILPDSVMDLVTILPKGLPTGNYYAYADVECGEKRFIHATTKFRITKERKVVTLEEKIVAKDNFRVEPLPLILEIPSGAYRTASVGVKNFDNHTIPLQTKVFDFWIDEEGQNKLLSQGSTGRSCSSWIDITPENFLLASRATKNVKITIRVPQKRKGEYYSNITFYGRNSKERLPVLVRIPNTIKKKGVITDFVISEPEELREKDNPDDKSGNMKFTILFKNVGNAHIVPEGKIEIIDKKQEKSIDEIVIAKGNMILPGGLRTMEIPYSHSLTKGIYTAKAHFFYANNKSRTMQKTFSIEEKKEGIVCQLLQKTKQLINKYIKSKKESEKQSRPLEPSKNEQ